VTSHVDPSQLTVFLTGATGYVGATFLQILLSLPTPPRLIRCLARDKHKGEVLATLSNQRTSVRQVDGDLGDHEMLSGLAEDFDVVIETAVSDDLGVMNALLEGMRRRSERGLDNTVFLHTSGTGTLADDAKGEYDSDVVRLFSLFCLYTDQPR